LKGGDPFLFGRGGEEAEFLKANGVLFEVVPGVTSAIAAPAYAGIPVTHRDFTSTLTIITGHEKPGKTGSSVPWEQVAAGTGTLVFLMGIENLPHIIENLIKNGRSPETPVALVRWGTLPSQEVLEGTLGNIVERVRTSGFLPPAVIVVGEVVELRANLSWFDNHPLFGKTIVVTRARAQASRMVTALEDLGAQVLEFPTISIKPLIVPGLKEVVEGIGKYAWLTFTSANGIKEFLAQVYRLGFDIRDLKGPQICAIGPVTAA
jgi:uroporphyrinogen III methyltransferase/synthase